MFTDKSFSLSEMAIVAGVEVVRDCAVRYVGKIPTRLADRLVPCGTAAQISQALRLDGVIGIVTLPELANSVPAPLGLALSNQPQAATYRIHEHLCELTNYFWENTPSSIHSTAVIHQGALVASRNVTIGAGTVIHPGAIVAERVVIGTNCSVGPGAVIGCDAFEVFLRDGTQSVLRQAGGVRIGDHVDIQAKTTIVRATFGGFTEIGDETKIDCQVHVAHDCIIGRQVRIAACSEISGRVEIGDRSYLGPNCSVSNGLALGQDSFVTIGSVVVRDVADGEKVTGNFAVPHSRWIRFVKSISRPADADGL